MLNGKRILITGGTGSFGFQFTETVLKRYPGIKNIVIFSRDARKQADMALKIKDPRIEYMTGDIAIAEDVARACRNTDIIIHTAALRIVPEAEANPYKCVCTNILGAQNLIDSAVKQGVSRILALSTDMASLAHNVYGATKMLSDRLFIAAHHEHPELKTSVIRYGNMFGSTGTVIPFFIRKAQEEGVLPVTDPRMTRFMSSLDECVDIALNALAQTIGGEIIAPKIKSYNIMTIAQAVAPEAEIRIVGLRPGENLYEEMITRHESYHTIEAEHCFVIVPEYANKDIYTRHYNAKSVASDFEFNSENNPQRYISEEIKTLISSLKI